MAKMIASVLVGLMCFGLTAENAPKVTVGEGEDAKTYELATHDGAKAYVDAYADNVQADKEFKQHEAAALEKMGQSILADGRVDMAEAEQLSKLLEGIGGQDELRRVLADAREDGVITLEESNVIASMIKPFTKRS